LPKLPLKSRLRLVLVLSGALLFAQLGAQAHAYSHLRATAAASSHAAGGQASGGQQDTRARACSDCLAFAPLLSTTSSPVPVLWVNHRVSADVPLRGGTTLHVGAPVHGFRSRAPPVHT
jgi:hypothetical protein